MEEHHCFPSPMKPVKKAKCGLFKSRLFCNYLEQFRKSVTWDCDKKIRSNNKELEHLAQALVQAKSALALTQFLSENRFTFFGKCSKTLIVVAALFIGVLVVAGLMVIQAPNDYQHGITGKILYIHVPSAWLSTLCYTWMSICAVMVILKRSQLAALCISSAAPIGATFTALTLITGALWGRPAWGTWWVWDARLTSVLLLLLLYLAVIIVDFFTQRADKQNSTKQDSKTYTNIMARFFNRKYNKNKIMEPLSNKSFETVIAPQIGAILTLFGFILVPIIKFSAIWWQALHQPTSLWRAQGPAIEMSLLMPLIVMAFAFLLLVIFLQILSLRVRILKQYVQQYQFIHQAQMQTKIIANSHLTTFEQKIKILPLSS